MARGGRTEKTPPAQRRPRRGSTTLLVGAAVVAVLVVLALLLAFALGGDDSESGPTTPSTTAALPAEALPQAAEVRELFAGIPQHGNVLGSPQAPVTMVEYVDLQCPFCAQFATEAFPSLVTRWVRTGKLKVELRPIGSIGPDSARGRDAILAAGEQGKLYDLEHLLYLNQGAENSGWLDDKLLRRAGASIRGLDIEQVFRDRTAPVIGRQVTRILADAQADTVQVTPTILVGKSGGKLTAVSLSNATDASSVSAAVEAALG